MGIPLPTTTVSISRGTGAPYEPKVFAVIASGVKAHFSSVGLGGVPVGGIERSTELASLLLDPCDLSAEDIVTDLNNGAVWEVNGEPVAKPALFGFGAHTKAAARRVTESVT